MINVSRTVASDIECIAIKPELAATEESDRASFTSMVDREVMYTFSRDEIVGAVIAAIEIYPGIVELYALTSHELSNAPVSYTRAIRWMLSTLHSSMELVRAQTYVKANYAVGVRFMESLGFEIEGRLRKYGMSREDHYIMGKVF